MLLDPKVVTIFCLLSLSPLPPTFLFFLSLPHFLLNLYYWLCHVALFALIWAEASLTNGILAGV